jgi:hypothetical protein
MERWDRKQWLDAAAFKTRREEVVKEVEEVVEKEDAVVEEEGTIHQRGR